MIKINKKLIPSKPFYVAVSGGVDSIAIAHLLYTLYDEKISICHFNHNLRPRNNVMQKAVEWFGEVFGIPVEVAVRNNRKITGSIEDALRKDRLNFFKSLNSDVVLGHHLNDAVESHIAINLINGKLNYKPIPEKTKFFDSENAIYRPFLFNKKAKLLEYAENNNLMRFVVEDETNQDNSYRRNWIRNVIIPQFESLGLEKTVRKNFYTV